MVMRRLESLRAEYEAVTGSRFRYFFCPILWKDEDAGLCRGHVINRGFSNSDRTWTIQRADVDSRFGTLFENDFLSLEQYGQPVIEQALSDKDSFRRFRPKLSVDGSEVDYYIAQGLIPSQHTGLEIDYNGHIVHIGMKLSESEVMSRLDGTWAFEADKDIRLPALVSVLKSAHLTLFHLLGYRYALSAGGYFAGKTLLGDLYLKTRDMERSQALKLAYEHCRPYINLVRPIVQMPAGFRGTITDRSVYILMSGQSPWAFIVFVRTGVQNHAAVLPILDNAESAARFHRFLESPSGAIEVRNGRLGTDAIEMSSTSLILEWPAAAFDS